LPNTTGATYEIGLKATPYAGALNLSASIYYAPMNHQLEDVSLSYTGPYLGLPGCCSIDVGSVVTKGIDLEAAGQILPGWQLHASYNYNVTSTPSAGGSAKAIQYFSLQPKNEAKIWTSYVLPGKYKAWNVGSGFRLESTRYTSGIVCYGPSDQFGDCLGTSLPFNFTQGTYEVLDLMAGYRLSDHWTVSLNATNITNTRYYATAGTPVTGNLYGEPRAFMLSIKGHF
jgi:outer membrane receptor for ferric coprogen and ferric-rhodotorulic acid